MPGIDVVDSTWIAARPAAVAVIVAEPANWARWWPSLELAVDEVRGVKGVRWFVRSGRGRAAGLTGTAEVWLEPQGDGVVAHFFLRLDRADGAGLRRRRAERIARDVRARTQAHFWALADQFDPGRLARLTAPAR